MANEDSDMPEEFDGEIGPNHRGDGDFDHDVDHDSDFYEPDTLQSPQVIQTDENVLIEQDMDEPPGPDEAATVAQPDSGAMSDLFSNLVALPPDPSSVDFRQAIQALRSNFEERQAYNNMVCDQLAMRGLPPNGSNVLDIGAWGTKSAVVADVRNWYASLALRLSAQHAAIPEAARRQSNQLFEQLWTLAVQTAMGPLQALQSDIVGMQARLDMQSQEARGRIRSLESDLETKTEHAQWANAQIEHLNKVVAARDQRLAELEVSIATAALAHRDALLTHERSHADEIRAIQENHSTERSTLVAERERLTHELQRHREDADAKLSAKDAQMREDAHAHALALDRARQDVREANARADAKMAEAHKLTEEKFSFREQMSMLQIENAKLEQKIQQLSQQLQLAEQSNPKELTGKDSS